MLRELRGVMESRSFQGPWLGCDRVGERRAMRWAEKFLVRPWERGRQVPVRE